MTSPSESSPPTDPNPRSRSAHRWRRINIVVIGLIAILLAWGYRRYWFERPIGSGPAGPAVDRALFEKPWSERPVLLLGFGDSVTAGYGASPRQSYFDRLVENPPNEFPDVDDICLKKVLPNLRAKNVALSGSTSLEHLDILLVRIEPQGPETFGVVVLTTGGNDIIHNYGRTPPREGAMYGATMEQAKPWIDNYTKRLDVILDQISAKFRGGCHFYLANIYDPTDDIGDMEHAGLPAWPDGKQVLAAYNNVIARCAERRPDVELVDMHGTFLGHGIHCRKFWMPHYHADDPHYWYFDNLEDPNDRGYDALRRIFLSEIARTLPERMKEVGGRKKVER